MKFGIRFLILIQCLLLLLVACNSKATFEQSLSSIPELGGTYESFELSCGSLKNDSQEIDIAKIRGIKIPLRKGASVLKVKGKIDLAQKRHALLYEMCDAGSNSKYMPVLYWLYVYDENGDSLQAVRINPFLHTLDSTLGLFYRHNEFVTLYENETSHYFIRIKWNWSATKGSFVSSQDTLGLDAFKNNFPEVSFSERVNSASKKTIDTLYRATCDLDLDGKPDRILILDSVNVNPKYEYKSCYTLKIEKQDLNNNWLTWVVSTKAIPASNEETTSYSGGFKCSKGYFGFYHIDEGGYSMDFEFVYDVILKSLVLNKVICSDKGKRITSPSHDRPPLEKFDFGAERFEND
jgi:hypothetical protein